MRCRGFATRYRTTSHEQTPDARLARWLAGAARASHCASRDLTYRTSRACLSRLVSRFSPRSAERHRLASSVLQTHSFAALSGTFQPPPDSLAAASSRASSRLPDWSRRQHQGHASRPHNRRAAKFPGLPSDQSATRLSSSPFLSRVENDRACGRR